MRKLLVVCRPTATGKTKLAIELAKRFDGEIVSADSRQVYKDMDIGTGKDIPRDAEKGQNLYVYYLMKNVKVWGYDIVDPTEEFSVAHYFEIAQQIISDIWGRNNLPILVGGTGLYIKAFVDGIDTIAVPPDENLRNDLGKRKVDELFDLLKKEDNRKALSLNESDRKNPRRIIRALEIAIYKKANKILRKKPFKDIDILFIGLKAPKELLAARIEKRVHDCIEKGAENEVKKLISGGVNWEYKSMQTIGYKEWKKYLEGTKGAKQVIEEWIQNEISYAKRQMTWFKKDDRISWFDVDDKSWQEDIENKVEKWYSSKV